jgi:copper chaperone CopZ
MTRETFTIPNISCHHCTASIQNELKELGGVKEVDGDPSRKTVTVQWDAPATRDKILATLKEINYPAAE